MPVVSVSFFLFTPQPMAIEGGGKNTNTREAFPLLPSNADAPKKTILIDIE